MCIRDRIYADKPPNLLDLRAAGSSPAQPATPAQFSLVIWHLKRQKDPPDPPPNVRHRRQSPPRGQRRLGPKGPDGDDIRLAGHRMTAAPEQIAVSYTH